MLPNRLHLSRFLREEHGAVTIDWVALTAAIMFMGVFAGFTVTSTVPSLANKLSEFLEARPVGEE